MLAILRVRQWYKNLIAYLPVLFADKLFDPTAIGLTTVAFLSLCCISSSNYLLNDLRDLASDQRHPEKKHRPLARGDITKNRALILAVLLGAVSLALAQTLGTTVVALVLSLFALSTLYTFFLKYVLFADLLTIATNFVVRAVTGAYAIQVIVSPWLILCTFFLALFLVVGKRHAEALFLKEKHLRPLLAQYTPELTSALLIVSMSAFMLSYSLYAFAHNEALLMTIPFALYVQFRYFSFIYRGDAIARHPEQIISDTPILAGIALWVGLTVFVFYGMPL